jgi:eukaryotic-like serine/threonine-protein kinase
MDSPSFSTGPYRPWPFLGPPQAPDEIGRLAQYRVLKLLGQGGMGIVFRAEDEQLRRPAALKVMRPDFAAHEDARARFLREARAAAHLKHDHIVTIYQVGEHDGVPFLAMEFLAGKSLEDWLRPDRRATVAEALTLGKQMARGLAAAHAAGLVHRDIKPANLWLEAPRARVKILDFGLARHTAGELTALTQDGAVVGTPAFMAPE